MEAQTDQSTRVEQRWTIYVCARCMARSSTRVAVSLSPQTHYAGKGQYADWCYDEAQKDEWYVDPDSALPFERVEVVRVSDPAALEHAKT